MIILQVILMRSCAVVKKHPDTNFESILLINSMLVFEFPNKNALLTNPHNSGFENIGHNKQSKKNLATNAFH